MNAFIDVALAAALMPAASLPAAHPITLPEGEGKAIVVRACVSCHSVELAIGRGYTADEWNVVLNAMIKRGAQISPPEFPVLQHYLAASFPATTRPAPAGRRGKAKKQRPATVVPGY